MPSLWNLVPILALGTLPTPDLYCYLITPAGQVVNLGHLCGVTESQPPAPVPSGIPAPVVGGNELVQAALEYSPDPARIRGGVANRGPVGIDVVAISYDVLDSSGRLIYQGVLIPTGGSVRVPAGAIRSVLDFVSPREMNGTPASVTVTEIRYAR